MNSPILIKPKRSLASPQRRPHLLSGSGVFLRLVRGEGRGDLVLELGQTGGPAAVRMTYERFSPISCGRPWAIAEDPRPLEIVSVESADDGLRVVARSELFEIIDKFGIQGDCLVVHRRWLCIAGRAVEDVAVGTALCAGNGVDQHITIPNVLYNNNPSAAAGRLVPRLREAAGEALIVEEHRLPIPGVNVEWREYQRNLSLTMLVRPDARPAGEVGRPECGSMGIILRPPGVELVSLSGVVALNGVKDEVYGAQNQSMPQRTDGYWQMEPGQTLEKTLYIALTSEAAEGRGFRTLVAMGWEVLRPRAHPLFGLDKTIDLKLNALRGRWREQNGRRGFICLPEPGKPGNIYNAQPGILYGWTGQSMRLAWCALQASAKGLGGDSWARMGAWVLDHYASAPSVGRPAGCRLSWQNLDDGRWYGSDWGDADQRVSSRSLGESLASLADCLLLLRKNGMPISPAWMGTLAEGVRFLLNTPLTGDGIFPYLFDGQADVSRQAPSAGGVTCATALLAAAGVLDDPTLVGRACIILDRYAQLYLTDSRRVFNGATLDAACEDKEAGLFYFLACARAFAVTRQARFAERALLAADWTATFIYHWDVPMRPGTTCANEGFRTSFWPGVSVQNMHLDVFYAPWELYDFAREMGNDRLMRIGLGMMSAWTHGMAQYSGHWGYDIPGEQAEQFFHTNYIQGPGGPELWRGGFNPWNPSWVIANVLDAALKFQDSPAGALL